jgi:hypothetical protein
MRLDKIAIVAYLSRETPLGPGQNNVQKLLARRHNGDILPLGLHFGSGVVGGCCWTLCKSRRNDIDSA